MRRKKNILLHGKQQLAMGTIFSGIGFLLYALASAVGQEAVADALVILFGVVSVYVFASVAAERRRDKDAVTYSMFFGQAALALLTCMCALLTLREKVGF